MRFPHIVAISYYFPWYSLIKVSNKNRNAKLKMHEETGCANTPLRVATCHLSMWKMHTFSEPVRPNQG